MKSRQSLTSMLFVLGEKKSKFGLYDLADALKQTEYDKTLVHVLRCAIILVIHKNILIETLETILRWRNKSKQRFPYIYFRTRLISIVSKPIKVVVAVVVREG